MLCKEIDFGMDILGAECVQLSSFENLHVFHIKLNKEVPNPSIWLDPAVISELNTAAHTKLSAEIEIHKGLEVLDVASRCFRSLKEFCMDKIHEERFQTCLLGRCAKAQYSGSKTLNLCVHFAAFLCRGESADGGAESAKFDSTQL